MSKKSDKDWLATFLLCLFLGELGIHHFYAGKIGLGFLYLCTGGLFGIGWLVSLIKILTGTYRDGFGRFIKS